MGGSLKTGTYEPRSELHVLVWPSPDVDGDGPEVTDDNGDYWTAPDGRVIKHYNPPKGFTNQPHKNEHNQITADNYVLTDDRGNIARDKDGSAISISEGQAVVISPDKTFTLLADGPALRAFADAHRQVSDDVTDVQPAANRSSGAQPAFTPAEQQATAIPGGEVPAQGSPVTQERAGDNGQGASSAPGSPAPSNSPTNIPGFSDGQNGGAS
jgi:hypothetical protein